MRILNIFHKWLVDFARSFKNESFDLVFLALFPFILGIQISVHFEIGAIFYLLNSNLFLLILWLSKKEKIGKLRLLLATLAIFFIGALNAEYSPINQPVQSLQKNQFFTQVEGEVKNIKLRVSGGAILIIKVKKAEKVAKKYLPMKIQMRLDDDIGELKIGDHISFLTHLYAPAGPFIRGGFDYREYLARRGITATASFTAENKNLHYLGTNNDFETQFKNYFYQLRKKIGYEFIKHSDQKYHNLILTSLFGYQTDRKDESFIILRNLGLAHLLAISGLHMGLVTALIFVTSRYLLVCKIMILRSFGFYRSINAKKLAAICAICAGFFYLSLTGGSIPTLRAFIMVCMMMLAILLDRRAFSVRNLSIAAWILLLLDPLIIYDVGFQLSFAATFGIILYLNYVEKRRLEQEIFEQKYNIFRNSVNRFKVAFILPLVTGLVTMPISLYHFSYIQTGGFFANILIIPLFSLIFMPVAILAFSAMTIGLQEYVIKSLSLISEIIYLLCELLMQFAYVAEFIPKLNPNFILSLFVALFLLIYFRQNWRYFVITTLLFFSVVMGFWLQKPILQIEKLQYSRPINFMMRDQDLSFKLSDIHISKFITSEWLKHIGQDPKQAKIMPKKCDIEACEFDIRGSSKRYRLTAINQASAYAEACAIADIILLESLIAPYPCSNKLVVDQNMLRRGHIGIYENANGELELHISN